MADQNLIEALQLTILNIGSDIDIALNNQTLSKMSFTDKNDPEILSGQFCFGNGYFNEYLSCECDIAFFGQWCEESEISYWGKGWTTLQIIFSFSYIILTYHSWNYLTKCLNNEHGGFCKKVMRIINTPKYMVILNLISLCTGKFIFKNRIIIKFVIYSFS
jgi:hypothetical protein